MPLLPTACTRGVLRRTSGGVARAPTRAYLRASPTRGRRIRDRDLSSSFLYIQGEFLHRVENFHREVADQKLSIPYRPADRGTS